MIANKILQTQMDQKRMKKTNPLIKGFRIMHNSIVKGIHIDQIQIRISKLTQVHVKRTSWIMYWKTWKCGACGGPCIPLYQPQCWKPLGDFPCCRLAENIATREPDPSGSTSLRVAGQALALGLRDLELLVPGCDIKKAYG